MPSPKRRRAAVGGGRGRGRTGLAPDAIEAAPDRRRSRSSSLGRASRITHARCPSVGRRSPRLALAEGRHGVPVHEDEAPERPRQRLLDVGLVVADQLGEQLSPLLGDDRLAAAPMVDERRRRDRAPRRAPLPARRGVDELLELRPAVRLVEDALADDVGQGSTVIQSLASRAARRTSCHVRSASSAMSVRAARTRTSAARRRLAQQAVGDEQPRARAFALVDLAEAALRRPRSTASGRRGRPMPGATRAGLEVLRIGELGRPRAARSRSFGVAGVLGEASPAPRRPACARDECDGARRASLRARRRPPGHQPATSLGRGSRSAPSGRACGPPARRRT